MQTLQTRTHAQKYFQKLFKAAAAEVGVAGGAVTIPTSMMSLKGKKSGKTKASGKGKSGKAKATKGKNKSARHTAGSTPASKTPSSDSLTSPQAMAVAAAAAAVNGVPVNSALAHPHLSMAMSGTANEPRRKPGPGLVSGGVATMLTASDGVSSMLAAANAASAGNVANGGQLPGGYPPLGLPGNLPGLLPGVLSGLSGIPGISPGPSMAVYPGFTQGLYGVSNINNQGPLANAVLAESAANNGADFGSMLPTSLTPGSSESTGTTKDAPTDATSASPQRVMRPGGKKGKNTNKRTRDPDGSAGTSAQNVTPVAGTGNFTHSHPLKQRKLMGTSPGLSLSISAPGRTPASPLLKHAPMSPWVSQVKKLPAPSRASSVRFSSSDDGNYGKKNLDRTSNAKRTFSYEMNTGVGKNNIARKSASSSSGVTSQPSRSSAASPSSTPIWSTAASRASEHNVFLKHGSRRFTRGASTMVSGRSAHRSISSFPSSSASSQIAVPRRRNYQTRQRTTLHSAVASGDITAVRRILSKIASQGGVLHSPMPSPTKSQVKQQEQNAESSPAGEGSATVHVSPAVVEAVNRPDTYGYTPLMVAVTLGYTGKAMSSPRSRSSSSNSSPKISLARATSGNASGTKAAGIEISNVAGKWTV